MNVVPDASQRMSRAELVRIAEIYTFESAHRKTEAEVVLIFHAPI